MHLRDTRNGAPPYCNQKAWNDPSKDPSAVGCEVRLPAVAPDAVARERLESDRDLFFTSHLTGKRAHSIRQRA